MALFIFASKGWCCYHINTTDLQYRDLKWTYSWRCQITWNQSYCFKVSRNPSTEMTRMYWILIELFLKLRGIGKRGEIWVFSMKYFWWFLIHIEYFTVRAAGFHSTRVKNFCSQDWYTWSMGETTMRQKTYRIAFKPFIATYRTGCSGFRNCMFFRIEPHEQTRRFCGNWILRL